MATYFCIFSHGKLLSNLVRSHVVARSIQSSPSTVINEEVEKHTRLAQSWWDPKGPMKALHTMNSVRIPFIKNSLCNTGVLNEVQAKSSQPFSNLKILDVGCGGGLLAESLARLGADVTAIDPSEDLIKIASTHAQAHVDKPPHYIVTNIEDFSLNNKNKFDVVVMSEVIEHIQNKKTFLSLSLDTLKPRGSLIVTTPQKTWFSYLGTIVMGEYVLGLVPKGTHSYDQFIRPEALTSELAALNCTTTSIAGFHYNPLSNHWSIGSQPVFNYSAYFVILLM
uniref:Ubiquinone biosynthesis O-methyltransferase, mitochondrial n=1 Tax=Cacopsylla melanoneura TaxID=428564 RepID=A0A8D8ZKX8_9HEMI